MSMIAPHKTTGRIEQWRHATSSTEGRMGRLEALAPSLSTTTTTMMAPAQLDINGAFIIFNITNMQ